MPQGSEACRAFEAKVQDLPELLKTTLAAANGAEPSAADLDRAIALLRSQMYDRSQPRHIAGQANRIALLRTLHQPNM